MNNVWDFFKSQHSISNQTYRTSYPIKPTLSTREKERNSEKKVRFDFDMEINETGTDRSFEDELTCRKERKVDGNIQMRAR